MSINLINKCWNQTILGNQSICVLNGLQLVRNKSMIKWCGYLELAEFKKRDPRWKTATWHRPKLMTWQDYQFRKWRAEHFNKRYPVWQSRMDYGENLVRLGLSDSTISKIIDLHPHCVQYLKRKVNGNVELLREAEYSNFVNHRPGDY